MRALRRYLVSEGKILDGEVPEWYVLIRAAKYLGVAPWVLADQPVWWLKVALASESAEVAAQNAQAEKASRKSRDKRG